MGLTGTSNITTNGHLQIGGCDTIDLVNEYGTPLIVYDEQAIRKQCQAFVQAFKNERVSAQVAYASKAFSAIAICQLMAQEGMSLDVVSGGELYTALQAGFPAERIHFHGNNKSEDELIMALEAQIGCFVVDNFDELHVLAELARERNEPVDILLRITPGVGAHTHEYISTGQEDSKFGFDLSSGQVHQALGDALDCDHIRVLGLHSHIGSQIFESDGFELVIERIRAFLDEVESKLNWHLHVLNVGGGFGIRYEQTDQPLGAAQFVQAICSKVRDVWGARDLPVPEIWIEPGRSIVGEAGTTLYRIGSQKDVPGVRRYLSVDGGMSDNLRVALYQAKYEAAAANRMNETRDTTYTIAGKLCESGDILIHEAELPEMKRGDVLAVFSTGAYGYSMANNYNRIPRPAVVIVREGKAHVIIERETYADLLRLDQPLVEEQSSVTP